MSESESKPSSSPSSAADVVRLQVGLAVFLLTLLVGCDATAPRLGDPISGETPPTDSVPEAADAALTTTPMQAGADLLSPGAEAKSGRRSAYGCYLASRPYSDSVRYRSVYLHFPADIRNAAGPSTTQITYKLFAKEAGDSGKKAGVRYARCVIPDAPNAQDVAMEQVVRKAEKHALWTVVSETQSPQSSEKSYTCYDLTRYSQTCVDGHCGSWEPYTERVCVDGGDGGSGGSNYPSGDDGGSDGSGGSDDSGGGSADQDGDTEPCEGNPDPGDDCAPAELAPPCDLSPSELESGIYLFDEAPESAKETFIETIDQYGEEYGLDSKEDVKHFVAQTAHESGGNINAVESGGAITNTISKEDIKRSKYVGPDSKYSIEEVMGDPQLMASIHRANTLGNGPPSTGDGWTYRGRGPIQLTWKGQYENFTEHFQNTGIGSADFVENPQKISNDARLGTIAALWYWDNRVIPNVEGNFTVESVTQAINGGTRGLSERRNQFEAAKETINC